MLVPLDQRVLGRLERERRRADAMGCDTHEQLLHRLACLAVPDELIHDAEPTVDRDDSVIRRLVSADDPQKSRLSCAVRPISALVDPEPTLNVTSSSSGLPSGRVSDTAETSM